MMTRDVSRRGAMWWGEREFSGGVRVTWYAVMTNDMTADILTKPLSATLVARHRTGMGLL